MKSSNYRFLALLVILLTIAVAWGAIDGSPIDHAAVGIFALSALSFLYSAAEPNVRPGVPFRHAIACAPILVLISAGTALGAVTGKIAGTVTDPSGAGIPMVSISVTNTAQGTETKVIADEHGDYIFPSVPVGTYDILFQAKGFRAEKRTGLVVDTNSEIAQNMTLQLAQQNTEITVSDTATDMEVHVETASTQMGDVVAG